MHQTQINIITNLAFIRSARYSELKPVDMEGSKFTYHLDELIKEGLIIKLEHGDYSLTLKGKQFANTLDIKIAEVSKRQIVTTIFAATREVDGETEYLLFTRKRNPWLNCQGFGTSRVGFGESIEGAVNRGLLEQVGLTGKSELFSTFHSVVYSKENELLEDIVFFAFVFREPKGEIKTSDIGDFKWVKKSELNDYVKDPIFKYKEIMETLQNFQGQIKLKEFNGQSNNY